MSYTLHIWNPVASIPLAQASLADIADRLEVLAQEPATDADRALFSKLGRRMWGLYPSDEEQDSAEEIFLGNPEQDGLEAINRLWTIQLLAGDHVRVLRDIAEQAKTIGLAVYDDQIGIGFDPRMGVMPSERSQDWQAALEDLRTAPTPQFDKAYIRKHIIKPINEKLTQIGFAVNQHERGFVTCTRNHGDVEQVIAYFISGNSVSPRFKLSLQLGVKSIDRINSILRGGTASVLNVSLSGYKTKSQDGEEVFTNEKQVRDFLIAFDLHLIPVIEKSKTVEGIDQLLFTPEGQRMLPENHSMLKIKIDAGNAFARCNIAGVAGNPRLEEILMQEWQLYSDTANEYHQKTRKQLMDLLQYFKDPIAFERERIAQKQA